jgi:hypothetical protein
MHCGYGSVGVLNKKLYCRHCYPRSYPSTELKTARLQMQILFQNVSLSLLGKFNNLTTLCLHMASFFKELVKMSEVAFISLFN